MNIEIRNAEFINKGAELMLHAILQQIGKALPAEERYCMLPNHKARPYSSLAPLSLHLKMMPVARWGCQFGDLAHFVPQRIREAYGLILDRDLNAVLDASGFAYGDQFGPAACQFLAQASKRWKRRGTKVVLLPQAFGPFGSDVIRSAMLRIIDNVDLIYARERVSYEHLIQLSGERSNIKLCPDFTNLVEGIVPSYFDRDKMGVCVVPNHQMLVKTTKEEADAYIPFLAKCVQVLVESDASPFLLVHEQRNDGSLAEKIQQASGVAIPIVCEADPLKIKGILGACHAVLGSRFHSLVSALSQGTPTIGTGWSHKYQMLFEDYGSEDGVLSVLASDDTVVSVLGELLDSDTHARRSVELKRRSCILKNESCRMWDEVSEVLAR